MFKNRNEQGSALLLTIIITMILLVLGGALVSFSLMERGQVGRDEADLRAYYIARSGADLVAQLVLENEDEYDDIKGQTTERVDFDEGYFTAEIEEITSGVRIVSTGVVGNRKRTVSLVLKGSSFVPGFDHAIYANGKIEITQGFQIKGDIATSGHSRPIIEVIDGTYIHASEEAGHNGDIFVPTDIDEKLYDQYVDIAPPSEDGDYPYRFAGDVKPKDIPPYPEIKFPATPTTTYNRDSGSGSLDFGIKDESSGEEIYAMTFDNYEFLGAGPHKIDLANKECTLVIKNLIFKSAPNIILENAGHLHLYVGNISMPWDKNFYLNYDGPDASEENLTLYYSGTAPFGGYNQNDGWQFSLAGNVIVDKAETFITAGADIKGNIFSNGSGVTIGGDGTIDAGVIYAPNAHVLVANGGATRAIISNTFKGEGGPSEGHKEFDLVYQPVNMDTIPEDLFKESVGGTSGLVRSHWER